jgi:hypothetical protein
MPNWGAILQEVQHLANQGSGLAATAQDLVRRRYLEALHNYTGRNVIAYYSGWLSKGSFFGTEINDEDKNGFMMAVHTLDKTKGLDLLLHTPGGSIASTQSIVDYLHRIFGYDIRAFIPQVAMSAGTMMACACKEIWMGKHSNLGPIDPQVNGIPAYGVLAEFREACAAVKRDPSLIDVWGPIIGQYRPTFLGRCKNAIAWSNSFVEDQLVQGMFAGDRNARKKAKAVVKTLAHYPTNRTHELHIHIDECTKMGLKVMSLESDPALQDLVLTVHHCYMHTFMNGPTFKAIENHIGAALFKQKGQQAG